jgi:hypothetical protein
MVIWGDLACPGRGAASLRCAAEPGPIGNPRGVWTPDQQRITPQGRRAAQHPGHASLILANSPIPISDSHNTDRHCERSEAIHAATRKQEWIASRSLSSGAHSRDPLARNDVAPVPHTPPPSRDALAPELCMFLRLENQRAQGKPGARCTRSRACRVVSTRVSHRRLTGTPGLPCAMVLTAYFALSPVTGLSCHRRLRGSLHET